jgi:hypothetical protein
MKIDVFTAKRIVKFTREFRQTHGQLPTLKDYENNGIEKSLVDAAEAKKIIEKFYVTLTNGAVVKGYKIVGDSTDF